MRVRYIRNMNIVPDTGTIAGRIIIPIHLHLRDFSDGSLRNGGHQICGLPMGNSPISTEGWAPTGLKYRNRILLNRMIWKTR